MPNGEDMPTGQEVLREFVLNALQRYSSYRDNKETMAYAGLALFTGATGTALIAKDWPPAVAQNNPWMIIVAFTFLWFVVIVYLRFQLRRRRWAAFRVAGCEWLLCEWLPGSPKALASEKDPITRESQAISWHRRFVDHIWPLKHSVGVIAPEKHVYPPELENSWIRAERRGSDALFHERIVHGAGWVAYAAVTVRTYFY